MAQSSFNKLKTKLAQNPDVTNPAALSAYLGRQKLGQPEMTRRSVVGRRKKAA